LFVVASIERAVTHAAELLLGAGAILAFAWGVLRHRIGILRWPLLAVALLTLGTGVALGAWTWHETRDRDVRGSPTVEFVPTERPKKRPPKQLREEPWPLYGYNVERTRAAPFEIRPPYGGLWNIRTAETIEGPPVVAYGRVFFTDQNGNMRAVKARTGRLVWKRKFKNCAAASAAVADGVVYQPFMQPRPCSNNHPGSRGFIAALDAKTGRVLWKFPAGAVESAPLIVGHVLYFGSWDRHVYAIDLRRKRNRVRWAYETDDMVVAAPAYANGTIFAATNGGRIYALNARTGKLRWRAESFSRFGRREYFYATPAVAYGRVFAGNTDGTVYAYGATTGNLLWARQVGTYVYAAPAVWRNTLFVGTWDGHFSALDVRTGDYRWRFEAPAGVMGAPSVVDGIVYFSTWGRFAQRHLRRVKSGPRGTFGLNGRNGEVVWRFHDGHYSAVVAQKQRIYVSGKRHLYALVPLARLQRIRRWQALEKCARLKRARARARCRSEARRGTSSGRRGSRKAARTSKR
jgi:outer membrane protein assembly factor BamB